MLRNLNNGVGLNQLRNQKRRVLLLIRVVLTGDIVEYRAQLRKRKHHIEYL